MILSAPLAHGLRLYRNFQTGDARAVAEVRAMFAPTDPCFLCDQPVGDNFRLFVTEDPARLKIDAILAPLCQACMDMPLQKRLHRVREMLSAMFPAAKHRVDIAPMSLLRRLGS
jgi:hypothetical protein